MSKWVKMHCYVVYAYYREELYQNDETPLCEEEPYLSYAKAENAKEKYQQDPDFGDVYIEEEEREFLFDDYSMEYLRTKSKNELLDMLDKEVQSLVGDDNEEWDKRDKAHFLAIKKVVSLRMTDR